MSFTLLSDCALSSCAYVDAAARTAVGELERSQGEARAVLKKMQQSAHKKYMYWFLKPVLAEAASRSVRR